MRYLKYILLVSFIGSINIPLKSELPSWTVYPNDFAYNMTLTGLIYLNDEESRDENDIIAAFSAGVCVGVASPVYNAAKDKFVYYLMVYSNEPSQVISFKIYDANEDEVIIVQETIDFSINGIIGNLDEPYVSSETIVVSGTDFLNFSIPNETDPAVYNGNEITIYMPVETDLTMLSPVFDLDLYATAKVNGVVQYSGQSIQDFTNPINYEIRGVNGSSSTTYVVKVYSSAITEFEAYNIFSPNGDGKNEVWKIQNNEAFRHCQFYMYYSTGNLVWESIGYNNDWDGTAEGVKLPKGTYYYVVKCEDCPNCDFKGSVTLIR